MKHVLLLGVFFIHLYATAQTGSVKAFAKISSTSGNLTSPLANSGRWGYVNAEGNANVRVGAPFSGGGALVLMTLNGQGTVQSETQLHAAQFPLFNGTSGARFGTASISMGDVNGDGKVDYVVGAPGLTNYGAIVVLLSTGNTYNADTIQIPPYLRIPGSEWGSHLYRNGSELMAGIEAGTGKVVSFGISPQLQMLVNQVYDNTTPILGPMLSAGDRFGAGVSLHDMDGDGVRDIICGAPGNDDGGPDRGAVFIVYRNDNYSVKGVKKISSGNGGFTGFLNTGDDFGTSVVPIGDIDQDGNQDIAVGAPGDNDGFVNAGAVWVLMLNDQGNVKLHRKISRLSGSFNAGNLQLGDRFGTRLAHIGDINGDGAPDIVVGTPENDDGGPNRGAVYSIMLDFCPPHTAIYTHEAQGPVVQFSIPGGPGMSFLWNFDDGGYSQEQNPVHTFTSNGNFNVCLQVAGPCGGNFYCSVIQITGAGSLGIRTSDELQTKMYPNPAKESVRVECAAKIESLRLTDMTGKTIRTLHPSLTTFDLRLDDVPQGLYFLEIAAQGKRTVKKLQVL